MISAFSWKTLLAFDLLHLVLQGQICLLLRQLLASYFYIPVPYNEEDIMYGEVAGEKKL